jgi:hypothetical protein
MTQQYSLDAAMPVLLRPDGAVQVGWDPRRAVLVRPPRGMTTSTLAHVLRMMRSNVAIEELLREAIRFGPVDADEFSALIASLVAAGVARAGTSRRDGRAASIRVHGRGPLSDLLLESLRCSGVRVSHTSAPHAVIRREATDLVVLADYLVADPRLVRDLHNTGIPHLLVRVRDGTGLVGPMVIPGQTSCLGCADLHRSDRDAAWPALAAQLRDTVGVADHSTVLATAALALGQVQTVVRALDRARAAPAAPAHGTGSGSVPAPVPAAPATLSTTLEFDVGAGSIAVRRWARHPRCPC